MNLEEEFLLQWCPEGMLLKSHHAKRTVGGLPLEEAREETLLSMHVTLLDARTGNHLVMSAQRVDKGLIHYTKRCIVTYGSFVRTSAFDHLLMA